MAAKVEKIKWQVHVECHFLFTASTYILAMATAFKQLYFCDMKGRFLLLVSYTILAFVACKFDGEEQGDDHDNGVKTKSMGPSALADSLLQAGLPDSAALTLKKALARDTGNYKLQLHLADIYWETAKYGDAIKAYAEALKRNDKDPKVWLRLGRSYYYKGNFETALEYLNQALRRDQYLAEVYFWKAYAFAELGEFDKALSNMQTVINVDPQYFKAHLSMAEWYVVDTNDLAIDYYSSAIAIDSTNPIPWQGRGHYYHLVKNNLEQARKDYHKALKMDSTHEETLYNLATLELETGNMQEAITFYKRLTQLNTDQPNALLGLGLAYKAVGEFEKARAAFSRLLTINPNDADAKAELSKLPKP